MTTSSSSSFLSLLALVGDQRGVGVGWETEGPHSAGRLYEFAQGGIADGCVLPGERDNAGPFDSRLSCLLRERRAQRMRKARSG